MLVEGEPGPTPLSIVEFLYVQGEYKVTVHIVGHTGAKLNFRP